MSLKIKNKKNNIKIDVVKNIIFIMFLLLMINSIKNIYDLI